MTKQDETLRLINFILCILSCIAICWAVIPLAWAIPMTVHSWGIYKGTKPNTTAFGVCTLIFVNIIGGHPAPCLQQGRQVSKHLAANQTSPIQTDGARLVLVGIQGG